MQTCYYEHIPKQVPINKYIQNYGLKKLVDQKHQVKVQINRNFLHWIKILQGL